MQWRVCQIMQPLKTVTYTLHRTCCQQYQLHNTPVAWLPPALLLGTNGMADDDMDAALPAEGPELPVCCPPGTKGAAEAALLGKWFDDPAHVMCSMPTYAGTQLLRQCILCFSRILCTSACLEALNGAWQHADASPSAPLLFEALLRWLACLPEEDGTNGAACTAGFAEAGAGLSPSPCGGTNGFAENVKPFPLGLACPLAFASDITGHHTGDMTRSAH